MLKQRSWHSMLIAKHAPSIVNESGNPNLQTSSLTLDQSHHIPKLSWQIRRARVTHLSNALLLVIMVEDCAPVLRPNIVPLPVGRGRVVDAVEVLDLRHGTSTPSEQNQQVMQCSQCHTSCLHSYLA